MKLLLRNVFVILLILTVAAQAARMSRRASPEAGSHSFMGLARLGGHLVSVQSDRKTTAMVADCPEPVILLEVGFDGSDDALLAKVRMMGAIQRYIYLGFVGEGPNLTSIAGRWIVASALRVIGLRSGKAPDVMVVAELPIACPDLTALDWSVLSPWT